MWPVGLFKELRIDIELPVSIYSDSKSTIQIVVNPVFHEHTEHIYIDCHFIREKVLLDLARPTYLNTTEQLAD